MFLPLIHWFIYWREFTVGCLPLLIPGCDHRHLKWMHYKNKSLKSDFLALLHLQCYFIKP